MAGYIVNKAAKLFCAHGGQGTPGQVSPRVKILGEPVVLQPAPWTVSGCGLPPTAGPPDTTAVFPVGSQRVRVAGSPVLLSDAAGTGNPTGVATMPVQPGQTRVRAT